MANLRYQEEYLIGEDRCSIHKHSTEGNGITDIKRRIEQNKKVIGGLNSIWWLKNESMKVRKHIGRTILGWFSGRRKMVKTNF